MSESIITPADAPAPSEGPGGGQPAPATTDSPISVTEAARLLARRRAETRTAAGQVSEVQQSPSTTARQSADSVPGQQATIRQPSGPSAAEQMAEALGLRSEQQAPPDSTDAVEAMPGYEMDGRRYTQAELRTLIGQGTDYTKKTQQLADQQRALQAQQEALASVVPFLQPELERLQKQIQGVPSPDPRLADSNPQEYLRQLAAFQHAQQEQARLGQLQSLNQQALNANMERAVQHSNQMLAQEFPAWANPETRSQWQSAIVEWALDKAGYTKAELQGLTDHRHLKTLMKAMAFDRMLSGTRTQAPVPRVQSANVRGMPPPPRPTVQVSNAEQAFDARPNVRNGALLLGARRMNGSAGR